MSRSITRDLPTLQSPDMGFASVGTFEFQTADGKNSRVITIPAGSKWQVPLHWHERYVETFLVLSGKVRLTINGKDKLLTPDDGLQSIQPYEIHGFGRGDEDGEVVVRESVDPDDGMKEVFFRNAFSASRDYKAAFNMFTLPLQFALTSSSYDEFPVILGGPFAWYVTHGLWTLIGTFARAIGLRPWYEEYTPPILRNMAEKQGTWTPVRKNL